MIHFAYPPCCTLTASHIILYFIVFFNCYSITIFLSFTLTFATDNETVIDAQFTALPNDKDGTLIILDEEIDAEA